MVAASEPTSQLSESSKPLFALSGCFGALIARWVVPLSPVQLNQTYLLLTSTLPTDSELDRGTKPKPLLPQSVLYPVDQLHQRYTMAYFRRNQLLLDSIGISLLSQGQKNAYVQNLFGPPPPFTAASSCPGLARQASGLPSVTPRELTPPLVQHCGLVAFAPPRPRRAKLATEGNSPARFSERMAQLLGAVPYYNPLFSGSFHSLVWELFSIPSRYLYAIGLILYLRLEIDAS